MIGKRAGCLAATILTDYRTKLLANIVCSRATRVFLCTFDGKSESLIYYHHFVRSVNKLSMSIKSLLQTGKDQNLREVLEQIHQHDAVSRTEIVGATGLSKATVSALVGELIMRGLVEPIGSQNTAMGRPRELLRLIDDAGIALGVELNDVECRVVLTNLRARLVRCVIKVVEDTSVAALLALMDASVREAIEGIDPSRILGMGVCVPGLVDTPSGTVIQAVLLGWTDVALGAMLAERYTWPLEVFSRGNAGIWGEHRYGSGTGHQNILYVRVGGGIGSGLMINGRPYPGTDFVGGEIGHVAVCRNGVRCLCGKFGCLATVATTGAILDHVRRLLVDPQHQADDLWKIAGNDPRTLDFPMVLAAAERGNTLATQAIGEAGRWLGFCLASIVTLLNLDMVIMDGPLIQAGDAVWHPLRHEFARYCAEPNLERVEIVPSMLKENAPAIGAASLILHEQIVPREHATMWQHTEPPPLHKRL